MIEITNLRFADASHTNIDMDVTIGEETFPFTYSSSDDGDLTKAVRELLEAGEYAPEKYAPPPPEVPQTVSAKQIRLALNAKGLRDRVENFVSASRDDKDSWEYATTVSRDFPALQSALHDIPKKDIDALFILAGSL